MLTARQSEYLAFIRSYAAKYDRFPSTVKIGLAMNVGQPTAFRMVESLCAMGVLSKFYGQPANYSLNEDFELPQGLQVALLQASERAAMKPKLLLAQIVREWCEGHEG